MTKFTDMGSVHFQSGRHRAARRTRVPQLMPPEGPERSARNWHVIDTPTGRLTLQWQPGIERWFDRAGERFASELCAAWGWKYVGLTDDQTDGRP
ncbi:MAG: hypothetical protein M3Y22_10960 [Pseudomonadota bacterium]|nr:hypothetical protein [Pseudomonadota bacterium]